VVAAAAVPVVAAAAAPRPRQGEVQPLAAEETIQAGLNHLELNAESAVIWAIELRIVGKKLLLSNRARRSGCHTGRFGQR
jgi:hypothetical protein